MQKVLIEVSEAIGLPDTIQLVRRWGGRTLAVPMKVDLVHPLAMTLGLDAAQRLVKHFAGVRLQLPDERRALLDMRNEAILAESQTMSQEALGLRWGLTRQGVAAVLRKMRERDTLQTVTGSSVDLMTAESATS